MRGIGCMYKLYDYGRYQGIYDSAGVEKATGLPRNRVNRYARNRLKYKGRFRIILAGTVLCAALSACNTYPRPDFEHMPQDRARWENPAGYGLPPKEVGR